jgi:cephalosporin-C deacetylase
MRIWMLILLVILLQGVSLAVETITLIARTEGGWQTVGLPYSARVSAQGHLESLVVDDFDFLAPSAHAQHGFFISEGDKPAPLTSVKATGDSLTIGNAGAEATLRFAVDGIHVTARNLKYLDGHCLRLEVSKDLERIKSPVTGLEYALPVKGNVSEKMRLIAYNGASLTLPGAYLYAGGKGYMMKLPWMMADGPEVEYTIEVATTPKVEDLIKVLPKAAFQDFTYWEGGAQPYYTELTNMSPEVFRGALVLSLRHYLKKAATTELREPVVLGKGATKVLTWTLDKLEPGLYVAEIRVERKEQRGISCYSRFVYHAGALKPPTKPADFDTFWANTLAEQAKIPLDLHIKKVKDVGKSELYKFDFAGIMGYRCYGWLSVPMDKTHKYPAVLALPSSGLHAIAPPNYGDNTVGMAINISNLDVDLPADQYDWRTWPAPYLVTGILDKNYYSMRFCYAAIVRAAELLASRPEVDADDIMVTGGSQGGGLTLIAAGLYPKFKAAVANVPALCRLDWNFEIIKPDYFPIGATEGTRPMISRTLAYYDAVHFTSKITCPIWVSVGLFDDVTPSMNVFCAYNVIPGKKTIMVQPFTGHGGGWSLDAAKGVWP